MNLSDAFDFRMWERELEPDFHCWMCEFTVSVRHQPPSPTPEHDPNVTKEA